MGARYAGGRQPSEGSDVERASEFAVRLAIASRPTGPVGNPAFVGLATALALAAAAGQAGATQCTPTRIGPHVAAQSEAWRQAALALVETTRAEGQPWSCAGGQVDVVARDDGGATLTVTDDEGHVVVREVASPDELEPLGQALLSKPLPASPAPPPVALERAPAPPQAGPEGRSADSGRTEPRPDRTAATADRALLSAVVAPRYAGKADVMWGGITAAANVPFGAWVAGAWGRYDGLSAQLADDAVEMQEVCVGAAFGRRFPVGAVALEASLLPSVAVISHDRGAGQRGEDTKVHGRIGAGARAVFPASSWLRAVVAFDAELAPHELGDSEGAQDEHDEPPPPPLPAYTMGLGVGLEVAVR